MVASCPGVEDDVDSTGEVCLSELHGKPVHAVIGSSPIEAWGKLLITLGMIDEIMYERAMELLESSRKEGMQEAKDKLENKGKKKDSSPDSVSSSVQASTPVDDGTPEEKKDSEDATMTEATNSEPVAEVADDKEPPSEEELLLLKQVQDLETELEEAMNDNENAIIELCDARIAHLGPFLCNPFQSDEQSRVQQASWLATAVRKEKARMGSTGNKKKVISAVDLLERNDSIANSDIEALVEGLPGSEFCDSYVFHAFRTGGGLSRSWVHEAQLKNEKETVERLEHQQAKEEVKKERFAKRKQKDDINATRKRQRVEEEEEKKKVRADERLARLQIQVDERLEKEAAGQREKVVQSFARSLAREFNRRRKMAEVVAAQMIVEGKGATTSLFTPVSHVALPSPSREYNEDVLRVWSFVSTFGEFFLHRGYAKEIPSLDAMQDAIDCVAGQNTRSPTGLHKSVRFLTNLAETLTKPLASRVTRMLFASLVALAPALQKEFGATFFNDVNAVKTTIQTDKKKGSNKEDLLIPVNSMTWKEVARLTFLADALGELGQQKHEVSHLLRGYRSAGHPSSKEYRRLRKVEDFPMALIQQDIKEGEKTDDAETLNSTAFRVDIPCPPLRNGANPDRLASDKWPWLPQPTDQTSKNYRNGIGLLAELQISRSKLKECVAQREKYMEDALVLKEEMERQKLKEQGVDVEEEDDDDDDDDASKSAAGETVTGASDSSSGQKELAVSSEAVPTEAVVVKSDPPTEDPPSSVEAPSETSKPVPTKIDSSSAAIGKETPYDDFCADKPSAPDLIRRCLAVLRAVAVSGPAEHFLYPVDPQTNPGYYDSILRPMCLREAGMQLYNCADLVRKLHTNSEELVEKAVAQFGRNIRLIGHNSLTYTNAGPTIVAAGTEMLRLFERLLFHWVLAPDHLLPKLTELDDEKCVEQHPTDEGSTVLLCDGCEGKYNVARLDPPLKEIPRGDWYCPRCVKGWWWGDVDPRIGKLVQKDQVAVNDEKHHLGCITSCLYSYPDVSAGEPSLRYQVEYGNGTTEVWPLEAVDNSLRRQNDPVPRIRCLEALVESRGYSFGIDRGLRGGLIPSVLNPNVSDAAARMALASSEFRETIAAVGSLPTLDLRDMTTKEWLRLLVLLITKCAATGLVENHAGKLESEAAERMAKAMDEVKKVQIGSLQDILPSVPDDPEDVAFSARSRKPISLAQPVAVPPIDVPPSQNSSVPPTTTPSQAPADEASAVAVVVDVGSVEIVDEVDINTGGKVSQSAPTNSNAAILAIEKENPFTQSNGKKAKRQKVLEDSFAGYFVKNQMKPTVASFTQDSFSPSADSLLSPSDPQLSFANLRCKELTCSFCGLSDADLGSPLVRVPDQQEWEVLMAHKSRSRRIHLVADIPEYPGSSGSKLCLLRIKVDGELFSAVDSDLNWSKDGGMLEFPLRAKSGFQNDLLFRYETHLPFVTGSLSAHECCASSAHNARKERLLQRYKDERAEFYEREEGLTSGRTLQIGRDSARRSYWKFAAAAESLFVCADGAYKFYEKPEGIASVIVSLKKDKVVKALLESFPKAKAMIADGSWKNLLFARRFPNAIKSLASLVESSTQSPLHSLRHAFRARDKVLVRSKNGAQLWQATIIDVATTQTEDAPIDAYLVGYNEWGSNFCEWVAPERVLASNDPNCELQVRLCCWKEPGNSRKRCVCLRRSNFCTIDLNQLVACRKPWVFCTRRTSCLRRTVLAEASPCLTLAGFCMSRATGHLGMKLPLLFARQQC